MITAVFKSKIDDFFKTEKGLYFKETPNRLEDIIDTERRLNVTIDESYKYILLNYGGAYIGVDLLPCLKSKDIRANETILDFTLSFRKNYAEMNVCNDIQTSYIISIEGNGDPIFVNIHGNVVVHYHDENEREILANSFECFILNNLSI